jgi:hypothetical protein
LTTIPAVRTDEPEQSAEPIEKTGASAMGHAASGRRNLERGLTELRVAVLGIVLTIGLSVYFGVPGCWWTTRLAAGLGALFVAGWAIRWKPSRNRLMSFAAWLIGE